MTTRTPIRSFLLALALALASCVAVTQIQVARAQALTDAMPTDPQITVASLRTEFVITFAPTRNPRNAQSCDW
jgi:hypothetical protein